MHRRWIAVLAFAATLAVADDKHQHPPATGHDHSTAKETAFGRAADPTKAQRTILVEMRDPHSFSPSEITVKVGEIVRFVAVNVGAETHEMVLGTMSELREHAATMKKGSAMHHHDEPHIAHAAP